MSLVDESTHHQLLIDSESIKTLDDLQQWARSHPSPIVWDILDQILSFYRRVGLKQKEFLLKENGHPDWKAMKARKKKREAIVYPEIEIDVELTPGQAMTPEIASALSRWLCGPNGRDVGTGFMDNLLSSKMGVKAYPRYIVIDMLMILSRRSHIQQ